jgi:hypothetical protein
MISRDNTVDRGCASKKSFNLKKPGVNLGNFLFRIRQSLPLEPKLGHSHSPRNHHYPTVECSTGYVMEHMPDIN